ncbi:aspartyl/asparaginyl beta-hydroxylase domain-containing protein [Delftia tsuruhatensis]|uniref:Aspartyl beta-hydroxylase n=1 Tax=Delftia tsuruhatensis TaxID=180282 RepID=A0ABM6DYT6_9BURK|nr:MULTISPECIES: aspartyl/asparaginyl beta-hydroxylase domain-containing protein [Delftia]AOV00196.1 aspartyl beta-hydroxylase [Delftia tsuruhatensis]MDH2234171.1 aspartyl/asparaginyl beta-hydroxylase domain-containing protein [Delftia tsuruhatensis]MDR6729528.1 quercetin dioxygenase-like cupin family protein [Delftia lacustris]
MNAMPALPCAHKDACAGTPLFARLDARVALQALREEVDALLSSPWCDHVNHGGYEGVWRVMPLRCQRQHVAAHPILQSFSIEEPEEDWEDLPLLQHCPAIRQVLEQLQCPLRSVRLMQLKAGSSIKPHRDRGLGLAHSQARLHVPVHTHPDVQFIVEGRTIPMAAGELWYFNADATHEVVNRGNRDRTHLVIDCLANAWLADSIGKGHAHA